MTTNASLDTSTAVVPQLTALDRCDSCGAQAYVRVTLKHGELMFCGHHADEVRDRLMPTALEWLDETARLRTGHGV
ncbi:hypothetical protein C8A06_1410 [Microbacteriaceae bacterium MWH-Ta3]|nr:hypothetical protein C8A06_1410 [Microbacteriaceae bacterium MWH-Ta3]